MPGAAYRVVALDFESKTETMIELGQAAEAMAAGRYVWIDVDWSDPDAARAEVAALGLLHEEVIEEAFSGEPTTQHARYPEHLHLVVSGCRLERESFELERVDLVVGERFLVTLHEGPVLFLQSVLREYREDFLHHARSPSFLVYEMWDHLLDNYVDVQRRFEERVEALQGELIEDAEDDVFSEVSELSADLLNFRKVLLPARAVLTDLSTRKSRFISEATQPFLGNMVGTVESVLQDLIVDREILAGSLNLYMSMVGHRTNRVMRRLTLVSVIFLPLTFLVGVYGMNFDVLPELRWKYGYLFFWIATAVIVTTLVLVLKRKKLL